MDGGMDVCMFRWMCVWNGRKDGWIVKWMDEWMCQYIYLFVFFCLVLFSFVLFCFVLSCLVLCYFIYLFIHLY